ncbi:Hypothetical predicted protein [Olea europaea subsp. europaea]|uniref:Uncharacterized protein n=1 Tax=Olea europaea subsp. europaea TaxID=158383 RepID=A0A8S0RSP1_OLEEU|nr:Hypothetical predicted protein [Olea europaea subsp. europaea]
MGQTISTDFHDQHQNNPQQIGGTKHHITIATITTVAHRTARSTSSHRQLLEHKVPADIGGKKHHIHIIAVATGDIVACRVVRTVATTGARSGTALYTTLAALLSIAHNNITDGSR